MKRDVWDEISKGYAKKRGFGRGARKGEKTFLKNVVEEINAKSVLDVGCGSGHHVRSLKSLGINAMGMDFSIGMLNEARAFGNDSYVLGNALEMPFRRNSFDLLICMGNTIGSVEDAEKAICEMLRVAGKSILLEFRQEKGKKGFLKRRFDDSEYGVRVWSEKEVGKMMNDMFSDGKIKGFRIITGKKIARSQFFYCLAEK